MVLFGGLKGNWDMKRLEITCLKGCIIQNSLAVLVVFLVLLLVNIENVVVVVAVGASAFIVFAMPSNRTASSKNIIGGHMTSFFVGSACALIPQTCFWCSLAAQAIAVGVAIFVMVLIGVGHPPAAATALGISVNGFSMDGAIALITSVVCLALAHHYLKPFLKDLV